MLAEFCRGSVTQLKSEISQQHQHDETCLLKVFAKSQDDYSEHNLQNIFNIIRPGVLHLTVSNELNFIC